MVRVHGTTAHHNYTWFVVAGSKSNVSEIELGLFARLGGEAEYYDMAPFYKSEMS
jgi:hypothetical protein